jgi:hypothetical protein
MPVNLVMFYETDIFIFNQGCLCCMFFFFKANRQTILFLMLYLHQGVTAGDVYFVL